MNLRPWDLWTHDGKPADGTVEILATLEGVLRPIPSTWERAIITSTRSKRRHTPTSAWSGGSARRVAPAAGHLVHMPSHIYIRLGDFAAAVRANDKAAAADRAYLEKSKAQGIYPMMYYSHNLHFLAVANAMQGRYADAKKAADQLAAHVGPHAKDMPMLEFFLPTPALVQVRFQRWDDILASPAPDEKLPITRALWHFARAWRWPRKRKATKRPELDAFKTLHEAMAEELPYGNRNSAKRVMVIPRSMLQAKIAMARKDTEAAIRYFEKAIEVEDSLNYIEPADWHLPVREALGAVLLRTGAAAAAEKVFAPIWRTTAATRAVVRTDGKSENARQRRRRLCASGI